MLEIKKHCNRHKECFCWTVLDTAVERISELEDYSIETPNEKQAEKGFKKIRTEHPGIVYN